MAMSFRGFVSFSLLSLCIVGRQTGSAPNDDHQDHTMPKEEPSRHPVILVPGLGGSQLWWRMTSQTAGSSSCVGVKPTSSYSNLWFNPLCLLPHVIRCFVQTFRLHYDQPSRSTRNTEGVDIQAIHFGHPKSVQWLSPLFDTVQHGVDRLNGGVSALPSNSCLVGVSSEFYSNYSERELHGASLQALEWLRSGNSGRQEGASAEHSAAIHHFFAYFADMVEQLVANGYTRGKDLRAAPYDFRKAPNEMGEFFNKTKKLIEETYHKNGNRSVVMVAHSMGNLVMLYFYNHVVSGQWKDKYIRAHVALSAPWAGSVKSLKLMCSGDSMGVDKFAIPASTMRSMMRTMPSTSWLMPSPRFWGEDEVLVSTPRRNYTVNDYRQLFKDLGYMDGYYMWQDTHKLIWDLKFPDVELHGLYALGMDTTSHLLYKTHNFTDNELTVVPGDGDGTVNRRSLEAFLPWTEQDSKLVVAKKLHHVQHFDLVKNKEVIEYVLDLAVPSRPTSGVGVLAPSLRYTAALVCCLLGWALSG